MGVLYRIIISLTPDEAMSGGLAKACVPRKNYSVPEKIEFLNEIHKDLCVNTVQEQKFTACVQLAYSK